MDTERRQSETLWGCQTDDQVEYRRTRSPINPASINNEAQVREQI
jgi:hypothetical protein